jgi:hypothetical protein
MAMAEIFSVGNMVALTGWLAMLVGLFLKPARSWAFLYSGLILPALLAVAYVYLLASQMLGRAPAVRRWTSPPWPGSRPCSAPTPAPPSAGSTTWPST